METPKFKDIAELHEYVFQLLLKEHEKDNSFLFTLRERKNRNKNYWFYGDDNSIVFSFWDFPNFENTEIDDYYPIYFRINKEWKLSLHVHEICYKDFINNQIHISGLRKTVHNFDYDVYSYLYIKNYKNILIEDILTDKEIIDNLVEKLLIQTNNNNVCFINSTTFENRLKRIRLNLQKDLKEQPIPHNQIKFGIEYINLKSLHLRNITHFSELHIDLSRRIICIIGENGSGKSSILKALALSLVGVDEENINKKSSGIVNLLKINGLDVKNETKEWALTGEIALTYNEQYRNEVHFQFEYGELSIRDEGDFENIQGIYYFPNLVLAFPQLQGKNENGNGISLIDMDKPNLKDVRALIYGESENPFEKLEAWIATLFAKGNQNEREKSKEHAIIAQLFEIISEVTASEVRFKTVIYEGENQIVWVSIPDAANGIPLSLISQGYSNVFGWIGYFMKRLAEVNPDADDFTQCPALVLIDEIDTYLHPKWQKDILQILADKFPNTQFIVTTHSPLVVTHLNNEKDDVAVYLIDKEKIEVIKVSGWDISSTLSEYFGVERRPIYYQAQIDDLFAEFEEDMINIDLIKEKILQLKSVLGENNPDIQSAERILTGISE